MSETTPQPPAPPAGWYNDSEGRMRWWDGRAWTDAYAPVVTVQVRPSVPFSTISITGFVLSLVALLFGYTGYFGAATGVIALLISIGGYADSKRRRGRGFAVAGIIIGASAITIGVLAVIRYLASGTQ